MKKVVYKKWICPDDANLTEYYCIVLVNNMPIRMAAVAIHDLEEESENGLIWNCQEGTEDLKELLISDDNIPSSKEEFCGAIASYFNLSVQHIERLLNEHINSNKRNIRSGSIAGRAPSLN